LPASSLASSIALSAGLKFFYESAFFFSASFFLTTSASSAFCLRIAFFSLSVTGPAPASSFFSASCSSSFLDLAETSTFYLSFL